MHFTDQLLNVSVISIRGRCKLIDYGLVWPNLGIRSPLLHIKLQFPPVSEPHEYLDKSAQKRLCGFATSCGDVGLRSYRLIGGIKWAKCVLIKLIDCN